MTMGTPRTRTADPRSGSGGTVPWWTVLSLAAVMAFGDGFVVLALRGAFGAVERAGQPFVSWVVESTLAVPVFAAAVLEVLTRTGRRSAPELSSGRAVVRTGLLTALGGTSVGAVWLIGSAAYDYRLQTVLGQHMSSMRTTGVAGCGALDCAELQQNATFAIQVEAVVIGLALLLATNVVLVGWLVALRGGWLRTAGAGPGAVVPVTRADAVRTLVGLAVLGAAGVHLASMLAGRAGGAPVAVWSALETALAVSLLVARPDPRRAWTTAVAVVAGLPLLAWSVAHTVGGSWAVLRPAGVGVPGAVVAALDLIALIGVVVLIRAPGWSGRPAVGAVHDRALVALCVVALAAVGATATTPAWTVDLGTVAHQAGH